MTSYKMQSVGTLFGTSVIWTNQLVALSDG